MPTQQDDYTDIKHLEIICLFMMLMLLNGCHFGGSDVHERRFMMGTMVEFTVVTEGVTVSQAKAAIADAAQTMQQIEQRMTIYGDHDNSLKRLNRATVHHPVPLDADVDRVLQQAVAIEAASHGAFSPALARLNKLWGFSQPEPPDHPPAAETIERIVQSLSASCLERTGPRQWQRQSLSCQADLGGIAKGYALDVGMTVLKQHGISHAMINAGGDIRLAGKHRGRNWRIGIRDPRQKGGVLAVLSLAGDISVVTSGDYERFYWFDGQRYHHILDPYTGYPARHYRSMTVVAPSAMLADAWSTALFVGGEALAGKKKDLAWMALAADHTLSSSRLMQQYLVP